MDLDTRNSVIGHPEASYQIAARNIDCHQLIMQTIWFSNDPEFILVYQSPAEIAECKNCNMKIQLPILVGKKS